MSEFPITDDDGLVQCTCKTGDLLRLLADASRRQVVAALENHDSNRMHVDRLAQQLAMTAEAQTSSDWRRDLHHCHLPMLEDVGVIDYDTHDRLVRYYHCDMLTTVLDVIESG